MVKEKKVYWAHKEIGQVKITMADLTETTTTTTTIGGSKKTTEQTEGNNGITTFNTNPSSSNVSNVTITRSTASDMELGKVLFTINLSFLLNGKLP